MIDWEPELRAFWNKYKDVETYEELCMMAIESGKFNAPVIIPRILNCYDIIVERFKVKNPQHYPQSLEE